MNQDDLTTSGIAVWHDFSYGIVVPGIPRMPGVYAICASAAFGRLFGESDILYIGCATNLHTRIRSYGRDDGVLGRRTTNHRLREYLIDGYLTSVGWSPRLNRRHARAAEEMLLTRYEREHGELPPLNRRTG